MNWPAGLVERMGYAKTIYATISAFHKDGSFSPPEGSTEHHVLTKWIEHLKDKRLNG